MILGAHVSVEGGVRNGPPNGVKLGCDAIQIFSKNQRQWAVKPLSPEETDAFREAYASSKLKGVMVHGSYLINCASPDPALWAKSRDALLDEVERCDALGIPRLVMHPGAHMGTGIEAGAARIADALRHVLGKTQASKVHVLLESMAGQGSTIGNRFEDLALVRELAGGGPRIGYCLDTCHLFSAGYDIADPEGYKQTMTRAENVLGLAQVEGFHLNDSKSPLNARIDRHENIGKGVMGTAGFKPLMQDRRFAEVPMVLETPGGDEGYVADLKALRRLAKSGSI